VITYSATLDVPEATLTQFTGWLQDHRLVLGTRKGARTATCHTQALLVLRWFRDDTRMIMLAKDAKLPLSTAYRYLHEGIDVLAAQAPDLHEVLTRAQAEDWSHLLLDGTLIETDRIGAKDPDTGYDLWYSGKHKKQGGNVPIICDPTGFPVWSSPVEPGRTHDLAASRFHVLPALYAIAALAGLLTLTDKGYNGAGIATLSPTKGRNLAPDNLTRNTLLTSLRALGERGNAILKSWRALTRIRLNPTRIGDIVASVIVLATLQRGNY